MSVYTTTTSRRQQGMAIGSLVLGILSLMCLGPLTALPAIILGHIAYSRSKNAPDQYAGGGLAIAGLALGYVGLLATMFILAGILLPALGKAKAKAQSVKCANQMKNVGLAFRIFSVEHGDRFPFNVTPSGTGSSLEATELDTPASRHLDRFASDRQRPRPARRAVSRGSLPDSVLSS